MPFEKGHKKAKGRPEGSQNKLTKTVKEVLNNAFDKMQEDEDANLFSWGKENPTEFYKLCAKLIPSAVDVTTKGDKINNFDLKQTVHTFLNGGDNKAENSTNETSR